MAVATNDPALGAGFRYSCFGNNRRESCKGANHLDSNVLGFLCGAEKRVDVPFFGAFCFAFGKCDGAPRQNKTGRPSACVRRRFLILETLGRSRPPRLRRSDGCATGIARSCFVYVKTSSQDLAPLKLRRARSPRTPPSLRCTSPRLHGPSRGPSLTACSRRTAGRRRRRCSS